MSCPVCNFADCIKVASDFVSCENVGRCWQGALRFSPSFYPTTLQPLTLV